MIAVNGYYHDGKVDLYDDAPVKNGKIILVFTDEGYQVSASSLAMMDEAIENFRSGIVSETLDLAEFTD